ncbi:MAG TPA: ribbon-helix-helix protein, CopG family [Lichenihabitans sp.]|jgi:predicted transcriptional regulator|nr:ribbon-helix-helix protein, CopG family [Lichenihabitans sp.]
MSAAEPSSITLHLNAEKRDALDAIARTTDRPRNAIIDEAIDTYLDLHRWQVAHVGEGLRQADAGEFVSDDDVKAAFSG